MKNVGIIGNGFVGNAIYENLKNRVNTKSFDISPDKCIDTFGEVISSDIIFVCLPTPMTVEGRCNTSYVFDFFDNVPKGTNGLFVIKSTIPIGTTEKIIQKRSDLRIVHNPEFLTADNAKSDFLYCERNVIGGQKDYCEELESFLYDTFNEWKNIPCFLVSSNESETIKYYANCYLAVKIAYFNNLYQTCQKFNSDYDTVRDAICEDHRIGAHHTKVPGPDGKFGFGGYCFPKDINALIYNLMEHDLDTQILKASWEYNRTLRDDV